MGVQMRNSSSQSGRRHPVTSLGTACTRAAAQQTPWVPVGSEPIPRRAESPERVSISLPFSGATPTGVPACGPLIYYEPYKLGNCVCKWVVRCLTTGGWIGHVWLCNY